MSVPSTAEARTYYICGPPYTGNSQTSTPKPSNSPALSTVATVEAYVCEPSRNISLSFSLIVNRRRSVRPAGHSTHHNKQKATAKEGNSDCLSLQTKSACAELFNVFTTSQGCGPALSNRRDRELATHPNGCKRSSRHCETGISILRMLGQVT